MGWLVLLGGGALARCWDAAICWSRGFRGSGCGLGWEGAELRVWWDFRGGCLAFKGTC